MRKAKIARETSEVRIRGELNIDGTGKTGVNSGIGPLDHLLVLFEFNICPPRHSALRVPRGGLRHGAI